MAMSRNNQTDLIRIKQIIDSADGTIGSVDAARQYLASLPQEHKDMMLAASLAENIRRQAKHRPVYEQEQLYDVNEKFAINDGEQGTLWVDPEDASIGQVEQENDENLAYLTGQLKTRQRASVDIAKVLDAADGDKGAGWKATRRAITS